MQDSALLAFNIKELEEALPRYPDLAWAFTRVMAAKHYICAQRLLHVCRTDPWIRVGELLKRMMQLHGQPVTTPVEGILLAISLTQAELGRMTGLTRVSITRVLKRMSSQGVIVVINRRIIILRPDQLLTHC